MEYDPDDPTSQVQLTKICQVIANPNSRRMLEMLAAGGPMTLADLQERIDFNRDRIKSAAEMMVSLQLLQKLGGRRASFGVKRSPLTYKLAKGGLNLVRSWLDLIASMSVGDG